MYPRARRRRTAARTRRPGELAKAIQKRINEEQARFNEIMEEFATSNEFADTEVWTGKKAKDMADSNAPVVLTYDGAGYEYLSNQGEMEYMGGSQLRTDIRNIAARMGYMTEDVASWAMGFYPDSSAEEYHPPKREMPQWLRDQLEDEFGPIGGGQPEKKKTPPLPEEQQSILREMRMSNAQKRRTALQALDLKSRAMDIMYDLLEDGGAPWESLSAEELAETAADALGHSEWTDDPDHPVWEWAYEVVSPTKEEETLRKEQEMRNQNSGEAPRIVIQGAVYKQAQLQELLSQYESASGKIIKMLTDAHKAALGKNFGKANDVLKGLEGVIDDKALKELMDLNNTMAGVAGLEGEEPKKQKQAN